MTSSFQKLNDDISKCRLCEKYINTIRPRPGFPTGKYEIMFIGAEPGPGATDLPSPQEYRERFMPWTSNRNTIKLLFADLQQNGFNVKKIYYTNAVKCPCTPKEAMNCFQNCEIFLQKQIQEISPKLLVVIGSAAKKMRLPVATNTDYHKTKYKGINTIIIRHPQGATRTYRNTIAEIITQEFAQWQRQQTENETKS